MSLVAKSTRGDGAGQERSDQLDWTVSWRNILGFCVVAYALSWIWWAARLYPWLGPWLSSGQPIDRSAIGPFDVQLGMFGPLLAAVVMRLWVSREGLAGSLRLRQPWRVYALAYLAPTALGVGAVCLNLLIGASGFEWAGSSPVTLAMTLLVVAIPASLTALGEEYGWRGYLLPRLLGLGEVKATVLAGLVWGGWHLPLLAFGLTYPGTAAGLAIAVFLFSTVTLSFLFTWFHFASGGGVLVAALVHGALNASSELTTSAHVPNGNPLLLSPLGLTTGCLMLVVISVAYGLAARSRQSQGLLPFRGWPSSHEER